MATPLGIVFVDAVVVEVVNCCNGVRYTVSNGKLSEKIVTFRRFKYSNIILTISKFYLRSLKAFATESVKCNIIDILKTIEILNTYY